MENPARGFERPDLVRRVDVARARACEERCESNSCDYTLTDHIEQEHREPIGDESNQSLVRRYYQTVESHASRRAFLKRTASLFCLADASAHRDSWARERAAQPAPLPERPRFDGEWLDDAIARQAAAGDWGHYVHRSPSAVVKPASVADITRIVLYANQRHLKVAMRGQGHSVHGQAQVEDGIVIDSRGVNAVAWHDHDQLDAQAGALWSAVATTALERRLIPPVLPDALMLSVGGTLSAGGTGDTSCGLGAQVDHVLELDVVTGQGEVVTCSPTEHEELFHMVLAGLGQCGLIVRARLRLVLSPSRVVIRTLTYDTADALIADQLRLATNDGPPVLAGEITKDADGRWRLLVLAGTFAERMETNETPPVWMAGLQFKGDVRARNVTYWEHLDRRTDSVTVTKTRGLPNPSLAVTMTERSAGSFLTYVLSNPEASAGIWRIEVLPMITARFKAPLHVIPEGPIAFTLRLQRRASAANAPDHKAMIAANQMLVERCLDAGGKIYPPFAPPLSRENWRRHYGAETWERFAAAKRRFDPNNVLTPGAGLFG